MSDQWLGLHNPDRHETDGSLAYCDTCGRPSGAHGGCWPDEPCKCCLVAEVEDRAAAVERVREFCEPVLSPCRCCETARADEAEADAALLRKTAGEAVIALASAQANIARVREFCAHVLGDSCQCGECAALVDVHDIIRALNGGAK